MPVLADLLQMHQYNMGLYVGLLLGDNNQYKKIALKHLHYQNHTFYTYPDT